MATAAIMVSGAMVAVSAWPSIEQKWRNTGFALGVPGGEGSLYASLDRLAGNPALDQRAPGGAALLAGHLPPREPALVLTEPHLTTEILIRADRRNVLPISNPAEDALIASSQDRVIAASEQVPVGTLLLTSTVPDGLPGFNELQQAALSVLHRRFAFRPVESNPDGLELVLLVPRGRQ